MALHDDLQVLGLTAKEKRVLLALREGANTPLKLARETGVSRPAVYAILQNLHKRGIALKKTVNGKVHWELDTEHDLDKVIYDLKRSLLKIPEGNETIHGRTDSSIIVHRGKEAIRNLILHLFTDNKEERFFWGFQGDTATGAWSDHFTTAEINKVNREIKGNHIITEALLPTGWFESETKRLGVEWAKDFEGRTARVNVIDPKYFHHGSQVFIFKDSIYLLALKEELIIEIRNSEIQKMILAIFEFMQDNSRTIDANELLRTLIAEGEKTKTPP
jgi:DNA-binding CsgD family transcriptional regulator